MLLGPPELARNDLYPLLMLLAKTRNPMRVLCSRSVQPLSGLVDPLDRFIQAIDSLVDVFFHLSHVIQQTI